MLCSCYCTDVPSSGARVIRVMFICAAHFNDFWNYANIYIPWIGDNIQYCHSLYYLDSVSYSVTSFHYTYARSNEGMIRAIRKAVSKHYILHADDDAAEWKDAATQLNPNPIWPFWQASYMLWRRGDHAFLLGNETVWFMWELLRTGMW